MQLLSCLNFVFFINEVDKAQASQLLQTTPRAQMTHCQLLVAVGSAAVHL